MSTLTQPAHPASPNTHFKITIEDTLKALWQINKGTPAGPAADYTDFLQNLLFMKLLMNPSKPQDHMCQSSVTFYRLYLMEKYLSPLLTCSDPPTNLHYTRTKPILPNYGPLAYVFAYDK